MKLSSAIITSVCLALTGVTNGAPNVRIPLTYTTSPSPVRPNPQLT
jgi:hypothetical protein